MTILLDSTDSIKLLIPPQSVRPSVLITAAPYLGHDWLENGLIRFVVDAISERKVDGVIFSFSGSDVSQIASPGKVLAILELD